MSSMSPNMIPVPLSCEILRLSFVYWLHFAQGIVNAVYLVGSHSLIHNAFEFITAYTVHRQTQTHS